MNLHSKTIRVQYNLDERQKKNRNLRNEKMLCFRVHSFRQISKENKEKTMRKESKGQDHSFSLVHIKKKLNKQICTW